MRPLFGTSKRLQRLQRRNQLRQVTRFIRNGQAFADTQNDFAIALRDLQEESPLVVKELRRFNLRVESQTEDGEALRRDEDFSYVSAWEYGGAGQAPVLHKEPLVFEYVTPTRRSYK